MEASTLQLHHAEEELIECWDDDGDLQWADDLQFPAASSATSVTSSSVRRSGHRDSISSRRSARSDLDSNAGDEDWQVLLQDNDNEEAATEEAIASVKNAGIPIPSNVPKSALIGGTIKRLGRRKVKRTAVEDWSEDLDLSEVTGELALREHETRIFPDSLRQIGSTVTSPVKCRSPNIFDMASSPQSRPTVPNLAAFTDSDDILDMSDVPTIKVPKSRTAQRQTVLNGQKATEDTDDFERDLELPDDGATLRLSTRKSPPGPADHTQDDFERDLEFPDDGTPLRLSTRKDPPGLADHTPDDFDLEWAEGSIGVRFAGTMRDGRSNRSSSASALSPSVSSCLTAESDDGLDGIVLPDGPLNLEESLRKRQELQPPQDIPDTPSKVQPTDPASRKEDFFDDLEIGDGDVFNPGKLTLNQNIKRKTERPSSPARRSATTITFTNKPVSPKTRIPRLSGHGHDRSHSTHLEPVSESGAPLQQFRRPQSRFGGHISHSSLPTLPTSSHTSTPSTPSRRNFGFKPSRDIVRNEPTTTSAQLLRAKRSMPAMRSAPATGPGLSFQRSPGRHDGVSRPSSLSRPKTPVERIANDSRFAPSRRTPAPFLPAGASHDQSHHASIKTRNFRRKDSDSSTDTLYSQRPTSRHSVSTRSDTPGRSSTELAPEALAAAAKRTITRPTRRRNFGDGTELESFDDLPTSASAESKFVKQPVGRGAPRSLRLKSNQSLSSLSGNRTDQPVTPTTPVTSFKPQDSTPRFARDTAASRNAREQRIASLNMSLRDRDGGPLAPVSANWKAQTGTHGSSSSSTIKNRRGKHGGSNKPHLIKPLGAGVHESKSVKGMQYNPSTYRWEGNENALAGFDALPSPKSPKTAPALITNVGAMQGVQVVGGMVFDPRRMCWLKLAATQPGNEGVAVVDDDEDPFAGLEDLKDNGSKTRGGVQAMKTSDSNEADGVASGDDKSGGESSDEWPITEEFDVGPEFIKRQRAEEEKWRRKVDKWVTADRGKLGDSWRWAIRSLVRTDGGHFDPQLSETADTGNRFLP
ncbi:cytokinesis regulator [Paecilomyces variotii No. 5]|uniref:Cytokinesis regulator n=1 Tax=Byssochlamys spectabilis (strain No. 5 / NBRC 109023) TaxID=1356009 RepID=V5GBP0_BYSSN|nr:cytokinesis regulator [Paecilomyces variotii No. 5]